MELGQEKVYDEMHLACTFSNKKGFIHHRIIEVTDTKIGTKTEVNHYHFQGWMDWQLPAGNSRAELSTLVE